MLIPINAVPEDSLSPEILGGKGYGLAWMASQGINVPPALVIPTTVCAQYRKAPKKTMGEIKKLLPKIRLHFQETFGYMPLLSVRSGARVSMPGMMDTILNVGLDDKTYEFWLEKLGPECAFDSRRRLITMYSSVVEDVEPLADGVAQVHLDKALENFKSMTGHAFPDTNGQILGAIEAVFKSWDNDRAKIYRKMHQIPEDWGTAVVLQAMVFGNLGETSATGVLFTRNPDTGENKPVGEWLPNAQGEDVVDGSHTPRPLALMEDWNTNVFHELLNTANLLEKLRGDVQDIEFTIQEGQLFVLQTRSAKRSALAKVQIALDLHPGTAVFAHLAYNDYLAAQVDQIHPKYQGVPKYVGIGACTGVAKGKVVKSSQKAVESKEPVILVTSETTPDDIAGMVAAKGVLTMKGGATSHAAVVARAMNRVCVVGLGQMLGHFQEGQMLTIDGRTGNVWLDDVPVISGESQPCLLELQKRMRQYLGCKSIGVADADLLDFSDQAYHPSMSETVLKALETRETLLIDLLPSNTEPVVRWQKMFGEVQPDQVISLLSEALPPESFQRLRFLTNAYPAPVAGQVVQTVGTLEALVLAQGDFVLNLSPDEEAVKTVLGWRNPDHGQPLLIDQVKPQGFVTNARLAQELLK